MSNLVQHVSDLPEGKQDCCEVGMTSKEFSLNHQSCIICYGSEDKLHKPVIYKPGFVYKECSPVVADPEGGLCMVVPMTDKNQEIIGIHTKCDIDLTVDDAVMCPGSVLRCATFDINRICWPKDEEGKPLFSVECLQLIAFNHDKPCFDTRLGCPIMPGYYQTMPKVVK